MNYYTLWCFKRAIRQIRNAKINFLLAKRA